MNKSISTVFATLAIGMAPCTSQAFADGPVDALVLERAVVVMRHGVRPPTKSAQSMASLSDRPWPDDAAWGAGPGELTPHGAQAILKLGSGLRVYFAQYGLIPDQGPLDRQVLIWGDGYDQRTRATAQTLGQGLAGATSPAVPASWQATGLDPLFAGLETVSCRLDPALALREVGQQGPLEDPAVQHAMAHLQSILAPDACTAGAHAGKGECLQGASNMTASASGVKIIGPLATASMVAEALLLEYENGLPPEQVGFGRASREDVESLMIIHRHTSNLTRRTPYIATRRANALSRLIISALRMSPTTEPASTVDQKLLFLVGHDTNLSNLSGVFGLNWILPNQPDLTSPGTAIAFERWKHPRTGQLVLKVEVLYQGMDQVRDLSGSALMHVAVVPQLCQSGDPVCLLPQTLDAIDTSLPTDCVN